MKCDVVANGIIDALFATKTNVKIVTRLSGTNFELGKK